MNSYKVTFVDDYFVLTTSIARESDCELADEIIAHKANEILKREYNFSPLDMCYDIEIEEVYA